MLGVWIRTIPVLPLIQVLPPNATHVLGSIWKWQPAHFTPAILPLKTHKVPGLHSGVLRTIIQPYTGYPSDSGNGRYPVERSDRGLVGELGVATFKIGSLAGAGAKVSRAKCTATRPQLGVYPWAGLLVAKLSYVRSLRRVSPTHSRPPTGSDGKPGEEAPSVPLAVPVEVLLASVGKRRGLGVSIWHC